jgi:hypothetical protein
MDLISDRIEPVSGLIDLVSGLIELELYSFEWLLSPALGLRSSLLEQVEKLKQAYVLRQV